MNPIDEARRLPDYAAFMQAYGGSTYAAVVAHRKAPVVLPRPIHPQSSGGHVQWGVNGVRNALRTDESQIFFVEFGRPVQPPGSLIEELGRALLEMAAVAGRVSVHLTGSPTSRAVIAACVRYNVPAVQTQLRITGQPRIDPHPGLERDIIDVTNDDVVRFADEFARLTGCHNLTIACRAMAGALARAPHVYLTSLPRCIDLDYDRLDKRQCGPGNWSYVAFEDWYAIAAWLALRGMPGFPFLWTYSPELLASFFSEASVREFIVPAGPVPNPRDATSTIDHLILQHAFALSARAAREDEMTHPGVLPDLPRRQYQRLNALLQASPVKRHLIPLHRLLAHLHVEYGPASEYTAAPGIFGTVEN